MGFPVGFPTSTQKACRTLIQGPVWPWRSRVLRCSGDNPSRGRAQPPSRETCRDLYAILAESLEQCFHWILVGLERESSTLDCDNPQYMKGSIIPDKNHQPTVIFNTAHLMTCLTKARPQPKKDPIWQPKHHRLGIWNNQSFDAKWARGLLGSKGILWGLIGLTGIYGIYPLIVVFKTENHHFQWEDSL